MPEMNGAARRPPREVVAAQLRHTQNTEPLGDQELPEVDDTALMREVRLALEVDTAWQAYQRKLAGREPFTDVAACIERMRRAA